MEKKVRWELFPLLVPRLVILHCPNPPKAPVLSKNWTPELPVRLHRQTCTEMDRKNKKDLCEK